MEQKVKSANQVQMPRFTFAQMHVSISSDQKWIRVKKQDRLGTLALDGNQSGNQPSFSKIKIIKKQDVLKGYGDDRKRRKKKKREGKKEGTIVLLES